MYVTMYVCMLLCMYVSPMCCTVVVMDPDEYEHNLRSWGKEINETLPVGVSLTLMK